MRNIRSFGPDQGADPFRVSEAMLPLDNYAGRGGYDPGFIGHGTPLPLPGAGIWADDLVELLPEAQVPGHDPTELKYTHFSLRMSRSRALPLFSACNIDGAQLLRGIRRTDIWRRDPRIDAALQNLREGYGQENRGLFSRGHMTRREDPNWGDQATAEQADADTFHITNVAPQRQGFNGGIWLDLENYVLNNTDRENMRVTVVTGPVLGRDDPVYYNRQIPAAFWKIIAFTHAVTGELTVIGYLRTQLEYLPRPSAARFVFGDFQDMQVPVSALAQETGLDLSAYADFDVMAGATGIEVRLTTLGDLYLQR
ncbi:DNA/RNA non-specific endonuclease [Paracoccus sp. DMF-8]|uniref:DNA/RNA non-specific endonuclease n=1 Tax=Paracoccus sp. DMF-8 TaxID=3019445 RepID=UPI0023E8BEA2|nr:DNA/RNA non-specific endonuclease [Paracoccus sp. DMF-8]MDF3604976.1 DNA/RNA non-specific endonuclease [Paracoccus sp. DMF-8]